VIERTIMILFAKSETPFSSRSRKTFSFFSEFCCQAFVFDRYRKYLWGIGKMIKFNKEKEEKIFFSKEKKFYWLGVNFIIILRTCFLYCIKTNFEAFL